MVTRSKSVVSIDPFDREAVLRDRLNLFLTRTLELPAKDYYSSLSAEGILSLKSTLSDINNILTLKVTLAFVDWVAAKLRFDEDEKLAVQRKVLLQKPSSNGWDVYASGPVAFIAEVKCNIPINRGEIYGSAQRHGIERDVRSLMNGKAKVQPHPAGAFKFMAFLNAHEIRAANFHLLRVSSLCREHLLFVEDAQTIERHDVVYGVYLTV